MSRPATVGSSAVPIDDVEAYLDEKLAFFREEGVRPPATEYEAIAKRVLDRAATCGCTSRCAIGAIAGL